MNDFIFCLASFQRFELEKGKKRNKINFSLLFKFSIANIRRDAIQYEEQFDCCRGAKSVLKEMNVIKSIKSMFSKVKNEKMKQKS